MSTENPNETEASYQAEATAGGDPSGFVPGFPREHREGASLSGDDIGLVGGILHFWLLDQDEVWIGGNGEVHFIHELDDAHLFNLLGFLHRQQRRLETGLGVWRGLIQMASRSTGDMGLIGKRDVQWGVPRLTQTMLWRALQAEYHDRFSDAARMA
jgi:hypothetical protein